MRYRLHLLYFIMAGVSLLAAQSSPTEQLNQTLALERSGKTQQAVVSLRALLDSKSLNDSEAGQAWNILGLTYKDQGDFLSSQHAFEQSIRLLQRSPHTATMEGHWTILEGFFSR